MVGWIYQGGEVSDKPPRNTMFGFIYLITYENGKKYIGKRQFFSTVKKNFGKRKLAEMTDKREKTYEMVTKENDWRNYVGSSKRVEGYQIKSKEILEVCNDKLNLTYAEQKWLMRKDVLVDDDFVNDCIGGKFYAGKISKGR